METGSSSEAELASRAQACTIGRGLTPLPVAAAATTGVSRTTVASRLSVAVVTAAAAKVSSSIRRGLPRPRRPTSEPTAANTPSAAHISATTRIAARNATTGSSSRTWSSAPWASTAPTSSTAPAARRPTSISTQPGGCTKATASRTRRATTATRSTSADGTAEDYAPRDPPFSGLGRMDT